MIYSIPVNDITYEKYKDSLDILHSRLNGHIDNMSILFKDITKQKNDDTSMYMPTDIFEKNNDAQPYNNDKRNSKLIHDLY